MPQFVGHSRPSGSETRILSKDEDNAQTVMLQPVGWAEMVRELVGINIEYNIPDQYPWKEEVRGVACLNLRTD